MASALRAFGTVSASTALLTSVAFAQSEVYGHEAWAPDLGYGFNVCEIGDIDADGVTDYLVSVLKGGGYVDVFSGRTGTLIEQLHETGCFGMGLAGLGDVNGDGVADFAVGAPREDTGLAASAGTVRVYSGVDRSVIYTLGGDQSAARFGISLGNASDVDGDGVDDLIVGSWWEDFEFTDQGSVDVFSGATGAHLFQARGTDSEEWFGTSVTGAGDVNGDSVPDILVGAPYRWYGDLGFPAGSASVFSGVDGQLIRSYAGSNIGDYFGTSVEQVSDVDGDGVADHAVGAPRHQVDGVQVGAVHVFSGATGALLNVMTGEADSRFGTRVADGGDLDGDGSPELLVSACACVNVGPDTAENGALEIRAAMDGALLARLEGGADVGFAYSVDALGDLNGDGFGELVFGTHWDDTLGIQTGSATVVSFADLALESSGHLLSIADGGVTDLDLDFGVEFAGRAYIVIGSTTGTDPGFAVGGVEIPLTFDGYTAATIANPNTHQLVNTFALLDGAGTNQAALSIGPATLDPAFVGLTVWYAAVVSNGTDVLAVSNAVPVTALP